MNKLILVSNRPLLIRVALFAVALYLLIPCLSNSAYGALVYVDCDLTSDCLSGDYSIPNRDCSGSDGDAYDTIAEAVSAISAGDTINIRAGAYTEKDIRVEFTGPLMTTIQAYNNEAVTIHNITVHRPTFGLSSIADNVTFKDLKFTSSRYLLITGWTQHSGNVWEKVFTDRAPGNTDRIIDVLFDGHESGNEKQSIGEVVSEYDWHYDKYATILYVYSPSDAPNTYYTNPGVAEGNEYLGIAIGTTSSGNGYIIIDNCEIDSFAHCGIKGGFKFWIKNCIIRNIGTTSRDHAVYLYGTHSLGNEAIVEHNFFENGKGSAFQIYHGGGEIGGYIIRYNIAKDWGRSGIQLAGSNNLIYNNMLYDLNRGLLFARSPSHDNIIKNNIFYANSSDLSIDFGGSALQSYPTANIVENNYLGSAGTCSGCGDRTDVVAFTVSDATNFSVGDDVTGQASGATATITLIYLPYRRIGLTETNSNLFQEGEIATSSGGGNATISSLSFADDSSVYNNDPPNIISSANPFIETSPSNWADFRLSSDSLCIDAAVNLGPDYANALDPNDTTWPPTTADQDLHGSGWEIGAFVYAESIKGDLTGDSLINIQDIQACVNHILGTQDWGAAADVNGDSSVDVLDVQEIVNIILSE